MGEVDGCVVGEGGGLGTRKRHGFCNVELQVWGWRSEQRSSRVGQGFGNWISSEGTKGCEWLIMAVSLNGLVVEFEGTGLFEMVSVIWLHGFMVVLRLQLG
ncbi:hypothetical protein M0R45_032568 [Rubus argutus]|uniref:Uncharacterized protein n=1 Tax=Rubus argutus TaxID=59490 RepID=A0AAW1WJV7_RUBAR